LLIPLIKFQCQPPEKGFPMPGLRVGREVSEVRLSKIIKSIETF
jgi:hypothetical protein